MLTIAILGSIFLAVFALVYFAIQQGEEQAKAYQGRYTEMAKSQMEEMFVFVDPKKVFYATIIIQFLAVLFTWLITWNLLLVAIAAVISFFGPRKFFNYMRESRLQQLDQQLPDALAMMGSALRAGASLGVAMEGIVRDMKPPISQEFDLMVREQRLGVDFDTALVNMGDRVGTTDFKLAVSAFRISREVGGNLAQSVESLSDTIRRRQMMEGKIVALTAQGKMQGYVMAGLPVVLTYVLYVLEPAAMSGLWTTWVGYGVLAFIIIMEFFGYMVIRKILAIDV